MSDTYIDGRKDKYTTLSYVLSVYSYPITAILILLLGLPTSGSNILLKLLYLVLYTYVFLIGLSKHKTSIPVLVLPLLAFFLVYSIRLVVDVSFRGIPFSSGSPFYVYSYFFGATLAPCLAIIFSRNNINSKQCLKFLFLILLLSNVLILLYLIFNGAQSYIEMFAGRANISADGSTDNEAVFLNPIWISQTGASLCLMGFCNLLLKKNSILKNVFNAGAILIGLGNLLIGASRGPLLSMVLLVLLVFFYYLYWHPKNIKLLRKLVVFGSVLFVLFLTVVLPFILSTEIFLFDRLADFSDNLKSNQKEARNLGFEQSFEAFLSNPVIGDSYVLKNGFGYPHNIILEVLMSTGLIGGVLFLLVLINLIRQVVKITIKTYNVDIFIMITIALLPILLGMTSGSIFVNPEIWVSFCIILAIPIVVNKKVKKTI